MNPSSCLVFMAEGSLVGLIDISYYAERETSTYPLICLK